MIKSLVVTLTVVLIGLLAGHTAAQDIEFSLIEATISDIQDAVGAGALTYESLVALYFQRIAEYDEKVHSVLRVNPSAVADAIALDRERALGIIRGPLHGIPVLLKDLIDQEGVPTTAGSMAMQNCMPPDDATLVTKLKAAGAVIMGKVSMSEFAASYGRLGFSALGGTVLNPYSPDRSASGSSSGSAAAVAANFAVFSLGSDTAGSVRGPASSTSLVGIKPTKGLVSLDGVIPFSDFVDVVGPLARTVEDATIALGVMTGVDPKDPRTAASEGNFLTDYTGSLQRGALSGKRMGKVVGFSGGNDEVDALFDAAAADLATLGATVVEVDFSQFVNDTEILQGILSGWSVLGRIVDYECEVPLDNYFASAGESCPRNLAELVNVSSTYSTTPNAMNPSRLGGFSSCLESSPSMEDPEYIRITEEVVPAMEETILMMMSEFNLDAFVYPTMLCPSRPTWYNDDPTWVCATGDQWLPGYVANIIGWPDITVPMGFTEATAPAGLSFFSPKWSEPTLIGFAYDYEQETMNRVPPTGFDALPGEAFTYSESASGSITVRNSFGSILFVTMVISALL
jgi:amidase